MTDLDWPEGSTFVIHPLLLWFNVSTSVMPKLSSVLRFYCHDSLLDEEQIIREDVYDDRGFVSSSLYFENGQPIYRNYLNAKEFGSFVTSMMDVGLWLILEQTAALIRVTTVTFRSHLGIFG
ncbi:MAG: accessory Sec system glycosyltransferase Asp1 [Streptococcus sp.]